MGDRVSVTVSTTSHGVRVVSETLPWTRTVSLGMWLDVGSRDETADEWGISHYLEHLLFKGTATRTQRDIAEAFDQMGGDANAFTTKETTCFHARVRDEDLTDAFGLLADMIAHAANAPDDVETERNVVLSEIAAYDDAPDELVHTDFVTGLLGAHPLARETLGTVESITHLNRDAIHAFYARHYRPHTLVVAACGNVEHDTLVALTEQHLADLSRPGGAAPVRHKPVTYTPHAVMLRDKPVTQTHLLVGVPGVHTTDEHRMAVRVLNTLLGGGMSSRLFQTVREEKGLCYTTYSYAATFSDAGVFGAYAATNPNDAFAAADLIKTVLHRAADTISETDVSRAKKTLLGAMVLQLDDTEARMSRLASHVLLNRPLTSIDDVVEELEQVSLADVTDQANRLFTQPLSVAVVGPNVTKQFSRWQAVVNET